MIAIHRYKQYSRILSRISRRTCSTLQINKNKLSFSLSLHKITTEELKTQLQNGFAERFIEENANNVLTYKPYKEATSDDIQCFNNTLILVHSLVKSKKYKYVETLNKLIKSLQPFLSPLNLFPYLTLHNGHLIGRLVAQCHQLDTQLIFVLRKFFLGNLNIMNVVWMSQYLMSFRMVTEMRSIVFEFNLEEARLFLNRYIISLKTSKYDIKSISILIGYLREFRIDDVFIHEAILKVVINRGYTTEQLMVQLLHSLANNRIKIASNDLMTNFFFHIEKHLKEEMTWQSRQLVIISLAILKEVVYCETDTSINFIVESLLFTAFETSRWIFWMDTNLDLSAASILFIKYYHDLFLVKKSNNYDLCDLAKMDPLHFLKLQKSIQKSHAYSYSNSQNKLDKALEKLEIDFESEVFTDFTFVDFWLKESDVWLEAVGSVHILRFSDLFEGKTELKLKVLQKTGRTVHSIKNVKSMNKLLETIGVKPKIQNTITANS